MSATSSCLAYARSQRSRFVAALAGFVRFASVSAPPQHVEDVSNYAAWLAAHLRKAGLDRVQVVPTRGHPIVYADGLLFPGCFPHSPRCAARLYVTNDEVAS